jgi:predicted acylesterase/phospholipase RssA
VPPVDPPGGRISEPARRRPTLATCFGGGGAFGIGFDMGVARALMESGIALSSGPMLGTSAGAWTAGALAVGADLQDILAAWRNAPHEGKTPVIELTRPLFGEARDARVSTAAIRLPVLYPAILSGADHDLADQVAASSSPPRVAVPHRIGGRRYIDAGILTSTSADRAPAADVLVVVAPLAGPVLGRFGSLSARVVRLELMRWRMSGGQVLFVRPNRAVGALAGTRASDVLDPARAEPTYRAAYELGSRCAERFWAKQRRRELSSGV